MMAPKKSTLSASKPDGQCSSSVLTVNNKQCPVFLTFFGIAHISTTLAAFLLLLMSCSKDWVGLWIEIMGVIRGLEAHVRLKPPPEPDLEPPDSEM